MSQIDFTKFITNAVMKTIMESGADFKFNGNIRSDLEPTSSNSESVLETEGKKIAQDLIQQALQNGLQLQVTDFDEKSLSGGNTAEFVGHLKLSVPFVLKLDSKHKKLALEAKAIRTIKNNTDLPVSYRACWPNVYAIRTEAPYAYLMEFFDASDGWHSLEKLYYNHNLNSALSTELAVSYANASVQKMMEGYQSSINLRQSPNTKKDYLERIIDRLEETAKADSKFSSVALIINGHNYHPWRYYIDLIIKTPSIINEITPQFTTVVHGDPNPGNILLNTSDDVIQLKFIDPKEWIVGDYLFDICKSTHFFLATGPVEYPIHLEPVVSYFPTSDGFQIDYTINYPAWTEEVTNIFVNSAKSFAEKNDDVNWEIRYQLGMAANLLGLPLGRLGSGKGISAQILYAEGIKWLHEFCKNSKLL